MATLVTLISRSKNKQDSLFTWISFKCKLTYKVTTKRKHGDQVVDNLLNQNFHPVAANEGWVVDIIYLKKDKELDVFGDCDGSIFASDCGLAYHQAHD